MDANQLAAVSIITHMLVFALAWMVQDVRQAGKQMRQVQEDFAETKQRYSVKEQVDG